jgi:hypothetical protein
MNRLKELAKRVPLVNGAAGGVHRAVMSYAKGVQRQRREAELRRIPQTKFREENVSGCELVLDREQLLRRLPSGGLVAELGVDSGDFSEQILKVTSPRTLVLVDIWGTDRYGTDKFEAVQARFQGPMGQGQVSILRRMSIEAAAEFPDGHFDWVYIDTDHLYPTTRDELAAWAPKVKAEGFIAGHDYAMGNWETGYTYGVVQAVTEFCVRQNWRLSHLTADFTENYSFAITRLR